MYPILDILDLWWPPVSVTYPGNSHLHGLPFGSWKRSGEAQLLCDGAPIWMWFLDTISRHGEQDKCSCHILLQDHAEHQCLNRVRYTQIHEISLTQQCQLRFLGHILRMSEDEPCNRYAFFIPTHGRLEHQVDRGQVTYPMLRSCRGVQEMICIKKTYATDRFTWRKFVVTCSAAECGWWWWVVSKVYFVCLFLFIFWSECMAIQQIYSTCMGALPYVGGYRLCH